MTIKVPTPAQLGERAREFTESGGIPAEPAFASTVLLLRPAAAGFEVYAQQRPATMTFAPNMYVFPGGSVDPRDAQVRVHWAGNGLTWWAERLGLDDTGAQSVVCAAVREVFEECGVLLAGPDESTVVGDVSGDDFQAERAALLSRELSLADLLESRRLVVRADLLVPWSRWLTPEFEPRRFDTYFFLARLPVGQVTRDVGGESVGAIWAAPAELAEQPMFPPTRLNLLDLAQYPGIEEALAAGAQRELTQSVMPRPVVDDEGTWLVID